MAHGDFAKMYMNENKENILSPIWLVNYAVVLEVQWSPASIATGDYGTLPSY